MYYNIILYTVAIKSQIRSTPP